MLVKTLWLYFGCIFTSLFFLLLVLTKPQCKENFFFFKNWSNQLFNRALPLIWTTEDSFWTQIFTWWLSSYQTVFTMRWHQLRDSNTVCSHFLVKLKFNIRRKYRWDLRFFFCLFTIYLFYIVLEIISMCCPDCKSFFYYNKKTSKEEEEEEDKKKYKAT